MDEFKFNISDFLMEMKNDTKEGFKEVKQNMASSRKELKEDIKEVKEDIKEIKDDAAERNSLVIENNLRHTLKPIGGGAVGGAVVTAILKIIEKMSI